MYTPKLSQAVFTALVSVLFSYLWAIAETEKTAKVMVLGAVMFLALSSIIVFMIAESSHYFSVTAYIEALVKMDSELRNQLAFSVPSFRLVASHGSVRTLFAETRATKEHIHLFLQDSNTAQCASKRNWQTAERPAWAWEEIYSYLSNHGMVGSTATGSDSYPWKGTAYQNLCVYFLTQDVRNMNAGTANPLPH